MQRPHGFVSALLIAMACSSAESASVSSCDDGSEWDATWQQRECEVLKLVNASRAAGATCGNRSMPAVPPLRFDSRLRQSARSHARAMATEGFFDHVDPRGQAPQDRMSNAGYPWRAAGENIAGGHATAADTVKQWLDSPRHCENLMDGKFTDLGVGYVNEAKSELKHYWVQNFGAQ